MSKFGSLEGAVSDGYSWMWPWGCNRVSQNPVSFGIEGGAAGEKGAELRAMEGAHVSDPFMCEGGFDMGGPCDGGGA